MASKKSEIDLPYQLAEAAKKCLWVREKGDNRGDMVDKFTTAINESVGHAWCAAFVSYCVREIETKYGIRSGLSLSEHVLTLWNQNTHLRHDYPTVGDVVVWRLKGTTFGHCGIVTDIGVKGDSFQSIEGNTNAQEAIDRDGQGVFLKHHQNKADMGKFRLLGFLRTFT